MDASALPTIVGLSSGAGRSGVAVIRLSGPRTRFVVEMIAGRLPQARLATLRPLRDGSGDVIDRGLVLYFPAPHSFTGEDVAEFHTHGSRAVVGKLLGVIADLPGFRLAEAGEFTRRAFEAGKLDLSEVEGLADLIDSETEWQRRQALRQMEGSLGRAVASWRTRLIEAMSRVEAELDFSDEGDVTGPLLADALARAAEVLGELEAVLAGFTAGERVRDGFTVVIAGPPNAGKSSLLNALARREAAIVSEIPGTTRDPIEVRLDIEGLPVTLVDTAGLRESADPIEAEGVRRALARADQADLVLMLSDIDSDTTRPASGANGIHVIPKSDLRKSAAVDCGGLAISAVTGDGIDALLAEIARRLRAGIGPEPALITRQRQRHAVAGGAEALRRALDAGPALGAELVAEELRIAVRALDRLIGRVDVEDVLDSLFAGFCIGK